jgi:UDP-N-acetylmuramoylalanine--D-glutamate ligase
MAVTVYDQSLDTSGLEHGFAVASGTWDREVLNGIDLVVASPGFSERALPVVETLESGLPLWSEIEFAWRHLKAPVVAITGTNGKTSVTEATVAMLDASGLDVSATGNIGAPLSDYAESDDDVLVVEVSSFQLRFIEEFHPIAAAITNVAVDHLDWHGSEHSYRESKARIFMNQTSNDLLVFDADDPGATSLAGHAPSELYPVSGVKRPDGGGGPDGGFLAVGDLAIDMADIPSHDPSHLSNITAAAALALRMGASDEGVVQAAANYRPGVHRRSVVAESNNIVWIDDSKATNPHAAVASIRAYPSVVLIAGGLAKGLDVMPLADEPNVRLLLGIGDAGRDLADAAGERGRHAGTLEVAVEIAGQAAVSGDTVLLAPGCASFDQFDSYETRGDRFAELARSQVGGDIG